MQEIELTLEELPDFESFLKEPGVKILEQQETENYRILICNTNQKFIIPKQDDNILIYGKDKTERIVSIEVEDDKLIIFKLDRNGKIITEIRNNEFWLLSPRRLNSKQLQLKGNQYYKFMSKFNNREDFELSRKMNWKFDCYSIYNPKEAAMVLNGITYFKGLTPDEVSVLSFDIETNGLKHNSDSKLFLISNTFKNLNGSIEKKLFSLDDFSTERELIDKWCLWVNEKNPAVLVGHNILGFDLPYLNFIAKKNNTTLVLGRDLREIQFKDRPSKVRKDGSQSYEYFDCLVYGREIIDTFFTALHWDISRSLPSYGLKAIINHLGFEKEGRSFIDASKVEMYFNNRIKEPDMWAKTKQYALEDADDSLKIYEIMIPSLFYLTQNISKSFQMMNSSSSGSQINSFLIRSYLQNKKSIPKATEIKESIKGGISFAVPGVYKNLFKIDLKSCYPSQILRFKLYDQKKDPDANFYKMVKYFTNKRFELKQLFKETGDKKYKDLDSSAKVFINSAYGTLTTPGLNFNSPLIGAKITEESRKIINQSLMWASGNDVNFWINKFQNKDDEIND